MTFLLPPGIKGLMIKSSHTKLRLLSFSRVIKWHFLQFKTKKLWKNQTLSVWKTGWRLFISYLVKSFFTRKVVIAVSIIRKCQIFSKLKYIIYKDIKKQESRYGTMQDTWCNCYLCFLFDHMPQVLLLIGSSAKCRKRLTSS